MLKSRRYKSVSGQWVCTVHCQWPAPASEMRGPAPGEQPLASVTSIRGLRPASATSLTSYAKVTFKVGISSSFLGKGNWQNVCNHKKNYVIFSMGKKSRVKGC